MVRLESCIVVFMIFLLEGGTPPGILYEYQNKGFVKFAIRKCLKRKGRLFLGGGRGEFQNGNGSKQRWVERFGGIGGPARARTENQSIMSALL